MSKRHLFDSPDGLVNKALRGIIRYNPSLSLDEANRVVFDSDYDRSKVVLISGGGSGHEPGWSGYVGHNMLAAAVQGDIFASPSTKQILAGVDAVPSDKGTILVITNYTGDCLHFGLANEKANAKGHRCRTIICGDDVSVGRKGSLVGRRGLAGQIGVLKVMGGAAGAGASLDEVYDLGVAFSQQIVSIAATLDHCHVPGRAEHATLKEDEVELGTGPHNEPGYKKLSPAPAPQDLIKQILTHCLDENDPERGYVKFAPGDESMLLVSNFGGMSHLEMGALVDELLEQLEHDWRIDPARVCAGFLETSLNAPAFSVSVINVTAAARACSYSADQIKAFFDARTNTYWESVAGAQSKRRARRDQLVRAPPPPEHKTVDPAHDLQADPELLEAMLRTACDDLVAAEPDLTRWDTVMGDGDCGETLKTGATALLAALDAGLAKSSSVVSVLLELEDIVESKMGGTLGGILGIFFVSLRAAVEKAGGGGDGPVALWGKALGTALENLRRYTPAKVGDRTVMDTLMPFAEAMGASAGFDGAVDAAVKGAEATKTMTPRLGRATYVGGGGGGDNKELPPDPGAWGAMVVIAGLHKAFIAGRK
ncbi:dihydroxyacetone kinase [Cordyceps fumosorosea ARSEF 2679]|uniref:Dihydroxyacetone kinase n=1 Tax=Cordyceps fumosorosea (strain ARSEF 2679) TaxID=1081104 RepID=A0A168B7L9_CORFA|nr:dihydroxyacetone kinase [Cordyceps fumosorosea ARSEF 2679]OAA69735.1 dihydroxyacetone kinase [Cordyceps fumosorosea ARSEF 2679]